MGLGDAQIFKTMTVFLEGGRCHFFTFDSLDEDQDGFMKVSRPVSSAMSQASIMGI